MGKNLSDSELEKIEEDIWWKAKQFGFSDPQLAFIWGTDPITIRKIRKGKGVLPVYKLVDTCSGEFEASTPYYYSTYEKPFIHAEGKTCSADESRANDKRKIHVGLSQRC